MSDHFEKVKSEILRRTANNGGPTTLDLLDAIEASNADFDDGLGRVGKVLSDHVKDDKLRAKTQAGECSERHRKLISGEPISDRKSYDVDTAAARAALVTEVAEAAAAKTLALAAEKARGVVSMAKGVAGETLTTAEEAAIDLANSSRQTWAMWGVGMTILRDVMLPLVIVVATLLITGKL